MSWTQGLDFCHGDPLPRQRWPLFGVSMTLRLESFPPPPPQDSLVVRQSRRTRIPSKELLGNKRGRLWLEKEWGGVIGSPKNKLEARASLPFFCAHDSPATQPFPGLRWGARRPEWQSMSSQSRDCCQILPQLSGDQFVIVPTCRHHHHHRSLDDTQRESSADPPGANGSLLEGEGEPLQRDALLTRDPPSVPPLESRHPPPP